MPFNVALAKFGGHLCTSAAEMPVRHQSDLKILNLNLAASRLQQDILSLSE